MISWEVKGLSRNYLHLSMSMGVVSEYEFGGNKIFLQQGSRGDMEWSSCSEVDVLV